MYILSNDHKRKRHGNKKVHFVLLAIIKKNNLSIHYNILFFLTYLPLFSILY